MSLIPHNFLPRNMLEMDNWARHTLDHFDPFDEIDHALGRNMQWLVKPPFMERPKVPKVPEKYRVTVDCTGYNHSSLKTEVVGDKLTVSAHEEVRFEGEEDYSLKEFKKTYQLPPNAETDHMISFFAGKHLVVEIPLKVMKDGEECDDIFPKIVDMPDGTKQMKLHCTVPQGIDPSHLHVTCKDRDLVIKAEDKVEKKDSISTMYYYKHYRLPENTDLSNLKCELHHNELLINAPLTLAVKHHMHVPIEHGKTK